VTDHAAHREEGEVDPLNPASFHLVIRVDDTQATLVVLEHVSGDEKVVSIIQEVFVKLALPLEYVEAAGWCLVYQGTALPSDAAIRLYLPATNQPLELILRRVTIRCRAAASEAAKDEPPVSEKEVEDLLAGLAVQALDEESGSEATALDEADTERKSAHFGPSPPGDEESGSQVTLLKDEEEYDEGAVTVQRPVVGGAVEGEEGLEASESCGESVRGAWEPLPVRCGSSPTSDIAEAPAPPLPTSTGKKIVSRHATVRYYNRMNPDQAYPLLVAITKDAIRVIAQKALDQRSKTIGVAVGAMVVIEPILPGCDCYPPKQRLRIGKGDDKVTFHVVPKVLGTVQGARVEVRCQRRVLRTIPLEVRVVSKTTSTALCVSTLFLPFVVSALKLFSIDLEALLQVLAGVFLAVTGVSFFLARPRQRDAFWDLTPEDMFRFSCPRCQKRLKASDKEWGSNLVAPVADSGC
jgi:hypothetical protein